jgi:two-component system, NarL family, sensor kinase
MKYKIITILIFFFYQSKFLAQSDTNIVNNNIKAIDTLIRSDLNTAKKKAIEAVNAAKNISDPSYFYRSSLALADIYFFNDQEDSVIQLLEPLLKKIPSEVKIQTVAGITYRLANSYSNLFQFEKGLEFSLKSFTYWEQLKDTAKMVNTLVNIATIYQQQRNFNASDKRYKEALVLASPYRKKGPLANVYNSRAILYAENNKLDSALVYFLKSTAIRESLKDFSSVVWNYNNLGSIYMLKKDWDNSLLYFKKALQRFEETENENGLSSVYSNLGEVYLNTNNFEQAKMYFTKARAKCSISNNPDLLENLYTNLSAFYNKVGDVKTAFKYSDSLIVLKDSLYGKRLDDAMAEMDVKYQSEKKDLEISKSKAELNLQDTKLKQRNYLILLISIIALLTSIAAWFYFNNLKSKSKLEIEQQQQRASLMVIESEQTERMRIARELHDGIGQKLTVLKMYASAEKEKNEKQLDLLDNTIQEVREISHKMIPEILSLGLIAAVRDLCSKVNIGETIECSFVCDETSQDLKLAENINLSIYRIVQEIINNMLKHANAKTIQVKFITTGDNLQITVNDDGKGFDVKKIKQSSGIGWSNIFTRASIIKAAVDVNSSEKGTHITLNLNI